jgi:hypothetical protein
MKRLLGIIIFLVASSFFFHSPVQASSCVGLGGICMSGYETCGDTSYCTTLYPTSPCANYAPCCTGLPYCNKTGCGCRCQATCTGGYCVEPSCSNASCPACGCTANCTGGACKSCCDAAHGGTTAVSDPLTIGATEKTILFVNSNVTISSPITIDSGGIIAM